MKNRVRQHPTSSRTWAIIATAWASGALLTGAVAAAAPAMAACVPDGTITADCPGVPAAAAPATPAADDGISPSSLYIGITDPAPPGTPKAAQQKELTNKEAALQKLIDKAAAAGHSQMKARDHNENVNAEALQQRNSHGGMLTQEQVSKVDKAANDLIEKTRQHDEAFDAAAKAADEYLKQWNELKGDADSYS